jgi:hypothetical protein
MLVRRTLQAFLTFCFRLLNARRPVSRVLSCPRAGMAIPLGRRLPGASRGLPGRRLEN